MLSAGKRIYIECVPRACRNIGEATSDSQLRVNTRKDKAPAVPATVCRLWFPGGETSKQNVFDKPNGVQRVESFSRIVRFPLNGRLLKS